MLGRLSRQWPWLVLACLAASALYRYGVTRADLASFLPQVWLYAKGLGLTLLLVISAMGIGFPLLRLLVPVEAQAEAPLFAAALGFGAISLLTLLAGVLGWLYPATAWAILIVGLLLFAIQAEPLRNWARSIDWLRFSRDHVTIFGSILLLCLLVGITYALTANGLTPPLEWDEAAYHLALPKLYVAEHRIFSVPYILYSNLPFNTEMLFSLALLLRSEVMASLVSFAFGLLLSTGLWLFSHQAFGRRVAFLAVVLFWSTPAVFRLSGTALVEIPLATYTFLSLWAFWCWHTASERKRGWLVLSAVLAGLAAGSKLTGALITIILAILVVFLGWRRRRSQKVIAGQVGLLAAIAFLLALPWYLKSLAYTGNPIWPFLNDWFGGRYWDALGDEYHYAFLRNPNLPMVVGSFLTAPWSLAVRPYEFGSYPLGILVALLPLLALVFRPHGDRPIWFLLAISGLFYLSWFFMTHQTRFLVPIVPCLCVLGGYALDRLLSREGRVLRLSLQGLVIGLILLQLPGITRPWTGQWLSRLPYLVGAESRQQLLTRHSDTTAAFVWANEHLPESAKVLLIPYESRGYFLDREYLLVNPIGQRILKLEQFAGSEALWRALRDEGISHIIEGSDFVTEDIRFWPEIEQLLNDLKARYADPVYTLNGAAVYELHQ